MNKAELEYHNLQELLAPYRSKGRAESASFLNWFLEHIYRLDDVSADDAICDSAIDKGVDGLKIENISEEFHFFKVKLIKKEN